MKVKIVNARAWYSHKLGDVLEVEDDKDNLRYYKLKNYSNSILKADTIPVSEIKYISKDMILHTNCTAGFSQRVGSVVCGRCEYNCGTDEVNQTVQCSWQDEIIGGKQMKRLEVSLKIQPDGKTVVAECTHIAEELRGKGVLAKKGLYDIGSWDSLNVCSRRLYVRGKNKVEDYNIDSLVFDTPEEAQAYVKIMNELIDEINNHKTNWTKVEEGAEVTWIEECIVYKAPNGVLRRLGKFVKYIPDINKIVVRVGNEVKVVDEDKVELI